MKIPPLSESAPRPGDLNPQQEGAVIAPPGPTLVFAGAGSGKTRVLVFRIIHHLLAGVPPERLLALTFTNKAAGEMRGRLEVALGPRARGVWMGTFHAVCARILRAEGGRLGLPDRFAILGRGECLALLKREMAAAGVVADRYPPPAVLGRIGGLKTALREAGEAPPAFSLEGVAARLAPAYGRALQEAGAVDFDDLLALPLRLFREHPDVLSRYRDRFAEILVDEYQDTNAVQNRLVAALAGEGRRVFAVGDDDQSIYRWRGAEVENIRRFERDFPGARICCLERNYRSSGRILAAAGEVMARARGRPEKKLFTENAPGPPVVYLAAADPDTEAEMLLEHLAAGGAGGKIPWGEAALFYRINTQSRPLEEAARRRGISYQVVKGARFFDRAEVQDLAAYLRLLIRPGDGSAFSRILNRPPRGLGPARAAAIGEGSGLTVDAARDALEEGRIGGAAGRALADLLDLLGELSSVWRGPADLIGELLARTGYRAWLAEGAQKSASSERRRTAARALEGAEEFRRAASAFEERILEEEGIAPDHSDALSRFLESLALMSEADELDLEGGKLSLMTLHAAKGLEFRAVAIAGAQEGLIPHGRSVGDPESREEERRLLYVGMTRAKERLTLSWARARSPRGRTGGAMGGPSRFLAGLSEAQLTRVGDHSPPPAPGGYRADRPRTWYDSPSALESARGKTPAADVTSSPPPQALGPFASGARVRHPKFGGGVVAGRTGTGERTVVTVDFERVGRKKLVLKYAPLQPASPGGSAVDAAESGTV